MELKVMTFNIQHGLDYLKAKGWKAGGRQGPEPVDLAMMAEVIRKQDPDVVGLNEVRGRGVSEGYADQAEQLAAMLGYHCYFAQAIRFDGVNPYGNAVLSKFPLRSAEAVTIPDPAVKDEDAYYETRCVLRARFFEGGGFTVLSSHFGLAKAEGRNAVETVLRLVREEDGPVVVMGDLNLEPDSPILAPLLEELTDTASAFTQPKLSFPSDEPRIKIDYILVKGAKVLEADIPAIVASDHRPYVARIEI